MKGTTTEGFTVVEAVLFIAISGLLMATLLGGWNLAINTQRYKDSIDTTFGYIQDQYGLSYNVENERSSAITCNSSSDIVSGTSFRGQSDCVLMGRYVWIRDGTDIDSYAIVGYPPVTAVSGDDATEIQSYNPKVVQTGIGLTESSMTVPWGAVMRSGPPSRSPINMGIIIITAPSGAVHTYITGGGATPAFTAASDITSANESEHLLCFDAGAIVQGETGAVVIRANASSRNSVETLKSGASC